MPYSRSLVNIFQGYVDMDAVDKKHIAKLIPPDFKTGDLCLDLHNAFSKILVLNHQNNPDFSVF